MRSPEQAIAEILGRVEPLGQHELVRLEQARGRVLARDVLADLDLPSFEKSAMDGFAVRAADLAGAGAAGTRLTIVGESRAGAPFAGRVEAGRCTRIYTGAELPAGADAVVPVEESRDEGPRSVVLAGSPEPGRHVCHRGEDLRAGERVLERGRRLGPVDLALLATVGCQPVPVARRPRVALATTGDELVPAERRPGPGEIREGNLPMLSALLGLLEVEVLELGILRDDPELLRSALGGALERADALVTTGGVSMGRYDLVGEAFEALGVEPVLHKVAIRPGKPIWFGLAGPKPVFGLPGNPVSCLVGLEVFVRPALAKLGGASDEEQRERLLPGRWAGEPTRENPRQQNLPVRVLHGEDGAARLEPVGWTSSGDLVRVAGAQGLAVVPPGSVARPGDLLRYRPLAW
jgi:molybdopterin molybdotransferase